MKLLKRFGVVAAVYIVFVALPLNWALNYR